MTTIDDFYANLKDLPKPYHDDGKGRVIYHGDCRSILPLIPEGFVDLVLTDPPYGIGFKYESHDDSPQLWRELMDNVVPIIRELSPLVVMPSCAIKMLPWWYSNHQPDWLIAWYKGSPGHASHVGFNDWEPHLVWGKPKRPMHDYFQTKCGFELKGHPCPKPVEWAKWLAMRCCSDNETILDPFMGSGTTLRAAKDLGRYAIGIEIEEKYCEIAAGRLAQDVLF